MSANNDPHHPTFTVPRLAGVVHMTSLDEATHTPDLIPTDVMMKVWIDVIISSSTTVRFEKYLFSEPGDGDDTAGFMERVLEE